MLVIGLTGGIGCGKTTVTDLFEGLGAPVVDADTIARNIVAAGMPALSQVTKYFGSSILNKDQTLNRSKLRSIIYNDSIQKKALENILHPIIYTEMYRQLALIDHPYGILSIPLLIETQQQAAVQRVLVIDCTVEQQISRVIARDKLSDKETRLIIEQQCSRDQRLKLADDIIDNSTSPSKLLPQVKKLNQIYLTL